MSNRNKQLIANLKMNGTVTAATFSPDGSLLLSHGSDGVVYVWDMSTRDCIHSFIDDGCVSGTSISLSINNQYIACGSDSGVVNVYDNSCLREQTPKPIKAVMNLTTSIQQTHFNQTGEILALSSKLMKNGIRLVSICILCLKIVKLLSGVNV
jgi:U3 small nucleolar RNA-associated protein 18